MDASDLGLTQSSTEHCPQGRTRSSILCFGSSSGTVGVVCVSLLVCMYLYVRPAPMQVATVWCMAGARLCGLWLSSLRLHCVRGQLRSLGLAMICTNFSYRTFPLKRVITCSLPAYSQFLMIQSTRPKSELRITIPYFVTSSHCSRGVTARLHALLRVLTPLFV